MIILKLDRLMIEKTLIFLKYNYYIINHKENIITLYIRELN